MNKYILIGFAVTLCLLITACSANNGNAPVESESPASISQITPNLPLPQNSASQEAKEEEPEPEPAIPLSVRHIIDSGHFEGSYVSVVPRDTPMFTTYINTALQMIYHFDEEAESELFIGVSPPPSEHPNGLMEAQSFYEHLDMRVVDGSGEEWVRQQADSSIESLVRMYQEWDESMKEHYSVEEYEQWLIDRVRSAKENEEYLRNSMGDDYETSFGSHNSDDMEFWPVEYIVAGRLFKGLQINTVGPASGFNSGITYLYSQIDVDVAVVISITSEPLAGMTAKKHINRFDAISTSPSSDPHQDTITISQVFERDGFTLDRIANIQLSINPDDSSVIVTTPEQIQAVWDTLSKLRITPEDANKVSINAEKAIEVDIQFANPNHATHFVCYGPIVIHGSEYYTFAEGFSEQALFDLIYEFIEPKPLPSIEVTHNASFADDGCLLFDNEHYGLRRITQGFTRNSVVASFDTETAIEGIVWDVFTTKEYPNRAYLLLISGTNIEWLCSRGCPQLIYTFSIASSYDLSAESITVGITNTSKTECGYGFLYRIDRNVNGTWEAIPLNFNVNTAGAVLAPGKTNMETLRLFHDQYDYQPGRYRIVFLDGLGGTSCEFILK